MVAGTVGRLVPEKDHLTFLRVLHRLRQIRSDVHGVIVGDGPLRNQLEAAAAQMGLTDAVSFLGERDDARTLMAGFDTFLLTSTIEGFPNVVLEAAFLGVPAVASRAGGSPDMFGDVDDMFEPGDADAAAERVLALIASPSVAVERVTRIRRRAFELFTADRMATRWLALYARNHEMHG
jgi:glycosyltransferase involved in cell wall biosynthesis